MQLVELKLNIIGIEKPHPINAIDRNVTHSLFRKPNHIQFN